MMRKRILLISDDPSYKEMEALLKDDTTLIYTAHSLEEGFLLFSRHQFFLVVLDISFSTSESIALLTKMCDVKSVPIFVLFGVTNPTHKTESLKMISGNYSKQITNFNDRFEQACALIDAYINENPQCHRCYTLIFGGNLTIDPISRQVTLAGEELNLTRKEFDLLFCLASHAGQVLSREQLYQMVWDENSAYNVDETVKAHIKSLRKKLTPAGAEYIKNVWGIGYRFSADKNKEQS